VHIRRAKLDVAQCRRFESAVIVSVSGEASATSVFQLRANADVMKVLIRKQRTAVTKAAINLDENLRARGLPEPSAVRSPKRICRAERGR
jgi:hypothetical protein